MTRITLDATTVAQLTGLAGPAQLCDDHGLVLGWYQPGVFSERPPSLKELSPFSDKELQRRKQQPGEKPLKEVLRELGAE